jgi:hypothetical protein
LTGFSGLRNFVVTVSRRPTPWIASPNVVGSPGSASASGDVAATPMYWE